MFKSMISLAFWLLSSAAFAATKEIEQNAPVETVDMIYVVLFGVIFIGMIVGFFIWMWISDGKKTEDNK